MSHIKSVLHSQVYHQELAKLCIDVNKTGDTWAKTCASFRVSFYDYMLASYI